MLLPAGRWLNERVSRPFGRVSVGLNRCLGLHFTHFLGWLVGRLL